jgi:hypothetical protein
MPYKGLSYFMAKVLNYRKQNVSISKFNFWTAIAPSSSSNVEETTTLPLPCFSLQKLNKNMENYSSSNTILRLCTKNWE